jgi:hypothetical protein
MFLGGRKRLPNFWRESNPDKGFPSESQPSAIRHAFEYPQDVPPASRRLRGEMLSTFP